MPNREQVIKILKECVELEKKSVKLYSEHLGSQDFFQGFSPEDRQRIHKTLKTMAEDSLSHQKIFDMLLLKAENPGKDGH